MNNYYDYEREPDLRRPAERGPRMSQAEREMVNELHALRRAANDRADAAEARVAELERELELLRLTIANYGKALTLIGGA